MDEEHLGLAPGATDDDPAGRANDRCSADCPPRRLVEPSPELGPGRARRGLPVALELDEPAGGERPRRVDEATHARIRASAKTASWWSPRMSCSCFAIATNRSPGLPSSWAARSAA